MEYIIGAAIPTALFLCLYIGYRLGKAKKPKSEPMSEADKLRVERLKKEINEIMGYNLSKALERKSR